MDDMALMSRYKKHLIRFAVKTQRRGRVDNVLVLEVNSDQGVNSHFLVTRIHLIFHRSNRRLFGAEVGVEGLHYRFRDMQIRVDFNLVLPQIDPPLEISGEQIHIEHIRPPPPPDEIEIFETEFKSFIQNWWNS